MNIELPENLPIKNLEQIKEEVFEKVINLKNPEKEKDLYFHQSGGIDDRELSFPAGVLNAESILHYGLLSGSFATRAGIKRSALGDKSHPYEDLKTSPGWVENLKNHNDKRSWGWNMGFVLHLPDITKYSDLYEEDNIGDIELTRGRVRPENIVGIKVREEYLNKNMAELINLFQNSHRFLDSSEQGESGVAYRLIDNLLTRMQDLNLEISDDIQDKVNEFRDKATEVYDSRVKQLGKDVINSILKIILDSPEFRDLETYKDYLEKVAEKYKIPIYDENNGLIWPYKLDHEELIEKLGEDTKTI